MKKNYLLILILHLSGIFSALVGQQLPDYGFLRENMILINPSFFNYSFIEDNSMVHNLSVYHNKQWINFGTAPVLTNIKYEKISVQKGSYPVKPRTKWGIAIEKDDSGDGQLVSTGVSFNYGYHLNLSEKTTISSGINFRLAQDKWDVAAGTIRIPTVLTNYDPLSQMNGLFDLGIFLRTKILNRNIDSWYFGLSGSQIASFALSKSFQNQRPIYLNMQLGCLLGEDLSGNGLASYWEPMIMIRYFPPFDENKMRGFYNPFTTIVGFKLPFTADLSIRYTYQNKIFGGIGTGWTGRINLEGGYQFQMNSGINKIKYRVGLMAGHFPVYSSVNIFRHPSLEIFLNTSMGKR
jgi:hypothetical protein